MYSSDHWRRDDDRDGTAPMPSHHSLPHRWHCRGGALCHDPIANYIRPHATRAGMAVFDLFLEMKTVSLNVFA